MLRTHWLDVVARHASVYNNTLKFKSFWIGLLGAGWKFVYGKMLRCDGPPWQSTKFSFRATSQLHGWETTMFPKCDQARSRCYPSADVIISQLQDIIKELCANVSSTQTFLSMSACTGFCISEYLNFWISQNLNSTRSDVWISEFSTFWISDLLNFWMY